MLLNYLDLFSGIGGFHKGLEDSGFKFGWSGYSEINKYAKSIYQKHFSGAEALGDVSNINVRELPRADKWIVTGGWPCQDNSIAGKRKGQSGSTRSGLLSQIIRIIGDFTDLGTEVIFIGENVKGLYSVNEGMDFIDSIRGLTYLDKDSPQLILETQLLNTRWFLPQNRERIYFVGHTGKGSGQQIFPIGEELENATGKRKGFKDGLCSQAIDSNYYKGPDGKRTMIGAWRHPLKFLNRNHKNIEGDYAFTVDSMNTGGIKITQRGRGFNKGGEKGICPTIFTSSFEHNNHISNCIRSSGRNSPHGSKQNWDSYETESGIRRLTPTECERLQGFPDGWTEGISDTQRYKCLGNAVSVPVVKAVVERIIGCQYI